MNRFGGLQPWSNEVDDAMLIYVIIAVWSEKYIGLMRDYALPTLLYANNLGSVARKHKCVLVLYCKEEEEETINKIPALEHIRNLCEVEIVHIDPESAPNAYVAMGRAHHHAAVRAKELAAKVIFYNPDGVMANGSLERAVFLAEQGKRAVMAPGPRISEGEAELHLKPLIRIENPISPRDMLKTVFPILHPEMSRYFWDLEDFSSFPSTCWWRVESDGFLIRGFHLHAFMVDFSRIGPIDIMQSDTLDGDFVGQAIGIWQDIHIEQDSDNLGIFSITPDDAFYSEPTNEPGSVNALRSTAYAPNVKPFHRYMFSHAIKMHVHDLDKRWLELEEETGLLLHLALQPIIPAEAEREQVKRRGFARLASAVFGTRVK